MINIGNSKKTIDDYDCKGKLLDSYKINILWKQMAIVINMLKKKIQI